MSKTILPDPHVTKWSGTTKNKFEVVYYMSYGLAVQSITFRKVKDKIIPVFLIKGDGLEEVSSRYQLGRAVINLTELESNLEKLEQMIKNEFKLYLGGNENGE